MPEGVMQTLGAFVDQGALSSQELAFVASSKADVTDRVVRGIQNMEALRDSHPDVFKKAVKELVNATQRNSFPSFLPPVNGDSVRHQTAVHNQWAVKHNWLPDQITKALECVEACGGNVSEAARRMSWIPRRTLEGWVLRPPKKLEVHAVFRGGHAGPKTAMSAHIEAQLIKLIKLANEEGEETCINWVLTFARDLADRDDFQPSEGWFYRYRHRALLAGVPISGRTPSEIFQNVRTRQRVLELINEFWETWLTARVRYGLERPDLILAWDEMSMPLEVHGKWIYVVGTL